VAQGVHGRVEAASALGTGAATGFAREKPRRRRPPTRLCDIARSHRLRLGDRSRSGSSGIDGVSRTRDRVSPSFGVTLELLGNDDFVRLWPAVKRVERCGRRLPSPARQVLDVLYQKTLVIVWLRSKRTRRVRRARRIFCRQWTRFLFTAATASATSSIALLTTGDSSVTKKFVEAMVTVLPSAGVRPGGVQ